MPTNVGHWDDTAVVTQHWKRMTDWYITLFQNIAFLDSILESPCHCFCSYTPRSCFSQSAIGTLQSGFPGSLAHWLMELLPHLTVFPSPYPRTKSDSPVTRWFPEAEVKCHLGLDAPLTKIEPISSGVAFVRLMIISWARSFRLSSLFNLS